MNRKKFSLTTCLVLFFTVVFQVENWQAFAADTEMDQRTFFKLTREGNSLSSKEVKQLEEKVAENPDDLRSTTKLLGYYGGRQYGNSDIVKKREKIILQLIKKHPESEITIHHEAMIYLYSRNGKKIVEIWKKHLAEKPEDLKILWNASNNIFQLDNKVAEKCLMKGQKLDPENPKWAEKLGHLYFILSMRSADTGVALKSYEQFKKAYDLSGVKRGNLIITYLAQSALKAGKYKEAQALGKRMLEQAESAGKKNWNYGNLIYYANFTLGMAALKTGEIDEACKYLIDSSKTPGSPQLDSFGPNMTLARELLKKGKKEAVITFLENCSKFWKVKEIIGKDLCHDWIKTIRASQEPDFRRYCI